MDEDTMDGTQIAKLRKYSEELAEAMIELNTVQKLNAMVEIHAEDENVISLVEGMLADKADGVRELEVQLALWVMREFR